MTEIPSEYLCKMTEIPLGARPPVWCPMSLGEAPNLGDSNIRLIRSSYKAHFGHLFLVNLASLFVLSCYSHFEFIIQVRPVCPTMLKVFFYLWNTGLVTGFCPSHHTPTPKNHLEVINYFISYPLSFHCFY